MGPDAGVWTAAYWYRNLRGRCGSAGGRGAGSRQGHGVFVEVSAASGAGPAGQRDRRGRGRDGSWWSGTLRRDDGGLRRLLTSLAEVFVRGVRGRLERRVAGRAGAGWTCRPTPSSASTTGCDEAGRGRPRRTGTADGADARLLGRGRAGRHWTLSPTCWRWRRPTSAAPCARSLPVLSRLAGKRRERSTAWRAGATASPGSRSPTPRACPAGRLAGRPSPAGRRPRPMPATCGRA